MSSGFDRDKMAQTMFKKLDTSGDGKIDKSELEAATKGRKGPSADEIMSKADTNGDGAISLDELKSSMPTKPPGGPNGGPPPGGPGGPGKPSGDAPAADKKTYDSADSNKDGIVSASEAMMYVLTHQNKEAEKLQAKDQSYNQQAQVETSTTNASTLAVSA
jgi:hypothetical protein